MNYTESLQELTTNFMSMFKKLLKNVPYDQSYKARTTEVISSKKIKVEFNGKTCTATTGIQCSIGDYVWICVPKNDWNNIYVVCKT